MPEISEQVARRTTSEAVEETFTVPAGSGVYEINLRERPEEDSPSTMTVTEGVTSYTQVYITPASATEFEVDYMTGILSVLKSGTSRDITVAYQGLGTVARAEWANQQTLWQEKSIFLPGTPGERPDAAERPNGILYFPPVYEGGITVLRASAYASSLLGVTGETTITVCNMMDSDDEDASSISLSLNSNTALESAYWAYQTGEIPVTFATDSRLYVRVTDAGGHGDITISVYPA